MASTHDESPATIIKSDRAGRRRYTEEYKNEVLAAYGSSGMSGPAFAEHCGLKYPTFASWVAKRRGEEGGGGKAPENDRKFVLAEFAASTETGCITVELPGGATARLAAAEQVELLAALVKALA
jgi:transposase-like protein